MTARMILLAAGALAALAGSSLAEDYNIPWFEAHPSERSAMLLRCHNDFRLAQTPECANAEAASIRAWGAQHQPFVTKTTPEIEETRNRWFKNVPAPVPP